MRIVTKVVTRLLHKDEVVRKNAERLPSRRRPRAIREKFQILTISGSPKILPAGCYSVFQRSLPTPFPRRRGQTRHSEPEFTHFASGDFIVIHSGARFIRRCVDTRRIKCRRFA